VSHLHELAEMARKRYPIGTQIQLIEMDDPYAPVPPGTVGTVSAVDDAGQLHMRWDNGRTLALIPGVDSFRVIQPELKPLKLYMPLAVDCFERNEWGDYEEYSTEIDPREAAAYRDNIFAALVRERMPEEKERGLMHWYPEQDAVNEKVRSAVFSVEEQGGVLWGTAECEITAELTPEEMDIFKQYISSQASDGVGEGFEQHPIQTPDGEIYAHLWSGDESWSIMTENEFEAAQSQQMGSQTMG
jgi:hypothetical protein